jgi:hypothetical protein
MELKNKIENKSLVGGGLGYFLRSSPWIGFTLSFNV